MAAATALGVATHVRNQAYFSYRAMCEDIVRKCDFHVRAYLNLLEVFRTDGQPDRGIALCQAQVHRDPDSVVAQCLLGEAYRLAKRYDEAEAAYRLAQAKNPRFEDAHYGLGQVAAERGDHQLAITHFRRAVELFPQFQKAHHALGKSLAILGRDTEAAESFHKAIAVGRYNTEAMQDLAVILDGQGRSVEAAALLREYLEVHPEHLFDWDSLGIACLGARDFRGAAEAFARVLAVDPHQAEVRVSLVRALAAAGEPEAALATLNTGIQLARQAGPPQAVARFDDLRRQLTGRPGPDTGGP
jgi:tetratricopeptide (TPR) repeat protein